MTKEIAPPIEEEIDIVKTKGLILTPEFVSQIIDVVYQMVYELCETNSKVQ